MIVKEVEFLFAWVPSFVAELSIERSKLEKELLRPESPVPSALKTEHKPVLPK